MKLAVRTTLVSVAAALSLLLVQPRQGTAQVEAPRTYENVFSANPFGILLELFNAEYERVITSSTTVGIGGSYWGLDEEDDYFNADLFWRFYMQERPLDGWAFGAKIGLTNVTDQGTYFGIGFDLNRSWLMGRNENFYIGAGFGLKRLIGADEDEVDLVFIPTIRLVNVGIAF